MPSFDGELMATFPISSHIWKPCLAEAGYLGNHGKVGEVKGGQQISPGGGHASSVLSGRFLLSALFRGNPFHAFSEVVRYVELDYF
jgi:hypothetical protein